jgi:predicted RecB family nuclease
VRLTEGNARSHKYHLCLTEKELILLSKSGSGDVAEITRLYNDLFALIDKKAEKIVGGR